MKDLSSFTNKIKSGINVLLLRYVDWQFKLILLLAFAVMLHTQITHPFYFGSGDPYDYLNTARFFLGQEQGSYSPWRAPGLAFYYILSGVVVFDSWLGFFISWAMMSVAIPLLIYGTLRPFNKNLALIAGIVSIGSMIPYVYSKVGLPEHLFHFLHFLTIFLIAKYFRTPYVNYLPYAICLAVFFLNIVRPVAILYYWIFCGCALLLCLKINLSRSARRHLILATICYMALMVSWSLLERYLGTSAFPTGFQPNTQVERRFAEVYFSGEQLHFVEDAQPTPSIKISDGVNSAAMYATLRWYVTTFPERWQTTTDPHIPYDFFCKFANEPEKLVMEVISKPNFVYFNFLRTAIQAKYGTGAQSFMYAVAAEHNNTGLLGIINYFISNPSKLFLGSPPPMSGRNFLYTLYAVKYRHALNRVYTWKPGTNISEIMFHRTKGGPLNPEFTKELLLYSGLMDIIKAENGIYSQEFLNANKAFIYAFPMYWENKNTWTTQFNGNPEGMYKEMIYYTNPYDCGMWEGLYWENLIKYYGVKPAEKLFARVAVETIKAYPVSLAIFWDNLLFAMFIKPFGEITQKAGTGHFYQWADILYSVRRNDLSMLPAGLRNGLQEEIKLDVNNWQQTLQAQCYGLFHQLSIVFNFVFLLLLCFTLIYPKTALLSLFLTLIYLYNISVISVFGNLSCSRYEDVFLLLPVFVICLGLYAAPKLYKGAKSTALEK